MIVEEKGAAVCKGAVDCDRVDAEESTGPRRLDATLTMLVNGGTEPDVVLVVVGVAGPGEVCDVVVGNRGTVGRLTREFL